MAEQCLGRPAAGGVWWVVLGALLLPCAYLPTLGTRFDFIDDGNLVYPSPPMPPGQRLGLVWRKVVANYQHLGPFRPVLWAHWEAQAEGLSASPLRWRLARLGWAVLSCGLLLGLLRDLRFRPAAALACAALALWDPYRGEIWTSLTLSEGVAMPYALLGLVCAVRAGRAARPWPWDLAGALGVLAALGCKNTFAAVVPAQVLLRLAPDGEPLGEAWRRRGRRAALLALTLLLPVGHFAVFKLGWHPGQYTPGAGSMGQLSNMVGVVARAMSPPVMGPGLLLAGLALAVGGASPGAGLAGVWSRHRAAGRAGLALLVCGLGIYLPMRGVSGRYAIPAVWGLDLLLAALLSELAGVPRAGWRRLAYAGLGGGLLGVLVLCLGAQQRFAARADLLWQALEYVEREAPPGACVGWIAGPQLGAEEGIHFSWHLHARGRTDVVVRLLDGKGQPLERRELGPTGAGPWLVVAAGRTPPGSGGDVIRRCTAFYWAGTHRYHLLLWAAGARGPEAGPAAGARQEMLPRPDSDLEFDAERAVERLMRFLAVEGVTGQEKAVGAEVVRALVEAGVPRRAVRFDGAAGRIPLPTQTGNLIVTLPGTRRDLPRLLFMTHLDTVPLCAGAEEAVVRHAVAAAERAGTAPVLRTTNGGLDANWLVRHGVPTITFGAGQRDVHTVEEYVEVADFLGGCRLALALATV
jgi:hypothetical protein